MQRKFLAAKRIPHLLNGGSRMKALRTVPALVVFVLCAGCLFSFASPITIFANNNQVTVTGEAEILVVPDEVVITLGVESRDPDLAKATQNNDDAVQKVIAATSAQGVDSKFIQTDYINIQPRFRNDHGSEIFDTYVVRKTIVVSLKDLEKFEAVLTKALGAGANYVHGIQFRTTDLRKHRDEARVLASKAAREKAELIAGMLGRKVGKARSIAETPDYWWSTYGSGWGSRQNQMTQNIMQNAPGDSPGLGDTVAVGKIGVKAKVTVCFDFQD
jgi:uncharacterized protein